MNHTQAPPTFAPDARPPRRAGLPPVQRGQPLRLYDKLGAHPATRDGVAGTHFAVWAPNADCVCVVGDFNGWDKAGHPLEPARVVAASGTGSSPGVGPGRRYKYHVRSRYNGYRVDKADPFAFFSEVPPKTASVVWDLDYDWGDAEWMADRDGQQRRSTRPISIYEVHLGSWMRVPDDGDRSLSYRELAPPLAEYVQATGLHPRRVPADHGAPVLRLVGLPDDRLLRRRPAATARRRT